MTPFGSSEALLVTLQLGKEDALEPGITNYVQQEGQCAPPQRPESLGLVMGASQKGAGMLAGVSGKALSCRWGGDEEKEGGSRRAASGGSSSSEEDEEKVSRAEELRQERLSAVVKRNLTGILLEVTDALFGAQQGP